MFKIAHLYPKELNLYGDNGNILYLKYFLNMFGVKSSVENIVKGSNLNLDSFDFIFAGGGPDSLQSSIYKDFLARKESISKHIQKGKPALFVCGSYQLLGKYYLDSNGKKLKGLGLFNFYTKAPKHQKSRIVGNISSNCDICKSIKFDFGSKIVGFENHNGRTYLNRIKPLGKVDKLNQGNNSVDFTEGFLYKKSIGTYLHGPILVKNPQITNYLLQDYLPDSRTVDYRTFSSEYISYKNALKISES